MRVHLETLRDEISPLRTYMTSIGNDKIDSTIIEYVEMKEQLLLTSCMNAMFYLFMKAHNKSVSAHPVMRQLLEIRYALEKMSKLDHVMSKAMNTLLTMMTMDDDDTINIFSKKNFNDLLINGKIKLGVNDDDDYDDDDDDDNDEYGDDGGDGDDNDDEDDENSDYMDDDNKDNYDEDNENDDGYDAYEDNDDDHFNRTVLNNQKASKKKKAAANINQNVDDIGEYDSIKTKKKPTAATSDKSVTNIEDAINAYLNSQKKGKKGNMDTSTSLHDNDDDDFNDDDMYGDGDDDDDGNDIDNKNNDDDDDYYDNDDDEYGFNALLSSGPDMKKRRKAPDENMNANDDDEDDLVAAFGKKKKEFNMMKKAHYTAEPRYGGIDDSVEVGQKRAASYQIMKNRGLTPHRKKANRNPRVKKRQQYNKAVIRRKGAVRDIITGVNNYGGESTGIKANLSRSRKL